MCDNLTSYNRIHETDIQKRLLDVLEYYYGDLRYIQKLATIESDGIRPDGLANEIFACFHHIARGLCEPDADAEREIETAFKSHLKRATFDSYKIAINSYLSEDTQLKEVLDYLVLIEDFEKYIPDGLQKINEINSLSREARKQYEQAKNSEERGIDLDRDDSPIKFYNKSLQICFELREKIQVFTKNRTYYLACAKEKRERIERKRDRKNVIWAAIISAILSATLVATLTFVLTRSTSTKEVPSTGIQNVAK